VSADLGTTAITIGGPGSPGKAFVAFASGHNAINPKAVFDVSKLAGVATAELPDTCTTATTTVTCPIGGGAGSFDDTVMLILHPVTGVAAGAVGTITVSASADNAKGLEHSATVTIADGIDLIGTTGESDRGHAKPGDKVGVPVTFANVGNKTAVGFQFTFVFDHGLVPDTFDNCQYFDDRTLHIAVCTLDDSDATVAPGEEVSTQDFGATVTPDALGFERGSFIVDGLAESDGLPAAVKLQRRATTGKVLHTVKKGTRVTPKAAKPTDLDHSDNIGAAFWDVINTFDRATSGDSKSGTVGDTVNVTIGVKNNGPAALHATHTAEPVLVYVFTVPTGTVTVSVPKTCDGLAKNADGTVVGVEGKPGLDMYLCRTPEDFLGVGASSTVQFGLKIDVVTPNATGTVSLDDPLSAEPLPADANPANDKALVVINPSTGGTGGGTGGETLPITGTQTGMLAGLGGLLLLAGGAMYGLGRRRRVTGVDGDSAT
jgi:LPXTG-motif cell wall-anchored protein